MSGTPRAVVDLDHPVNRGIVAYLSARARADREHRPQAAPAETTDPYYALGTHPEIVERLWDELGVTLPADCRWVLYGNPVLVRHDSGIVFGFAGGSLTYALRLPPAEHAAAIAAGATAVHHYPAYPELGIETWSLDLKRFGPEWLFMQWLAGEEAWCRAAYDSAGGS